MKVNLISYSQPTTNDKSIQDLIAYCARVSNPLNQHNTETNEKLINYLIKNKHWSPFEMVNICIEIETTRDIIRQILRHRSFSFQEFSQRYAVADLGFEYKDARLQDNKNRQNSIEIIDNEELKQEWIAKQKQLVEVVEENYHWALSNGIAKEQARAVLPEGMTLSKIYMNGTLRSWIHYIELRSSNGTQKEHRDVAIACANVIDTIFPISKMLNI
uniref:Thymidylate synthase n=1 Tax=viral metagenome TaxID=1070528 RepID=A0A6C0E1F6_9ZZZZ